MKNTINLRLKLMDFIKIGNNERLLLALSRLLQRIKLVVFNVRFTPESRHSASSVVNLRYRLVEVAAQSRCSS